jgi:hypothetical protein
MRRQTAVAWAGRPSELPKDRLEGDEAWFIAQGALGLRLSTRCRSTTPASRSAPFAAEQSIRPPSSVGRGARALTSFSSRETRSVSLELAFEDIRAHAGS